MQILMKKLGIRISIIVSYWNIITWNLKLSIITRVIIIRKGKLLFSLDRPNEKFLGVISCSYLRRGREWVVVICGWTYLWITSSINCTGLLSMGVYLQGAYLRNFIVGVLNSTSKNLANVLKDFLWLKATLQKLLRSRYFPENFPEKALSDNSYTFTF